MGRMSTEEYKARRREIIERYRRHAAAEGAKAE